MNKKDTFRKKKTFKKDVSPQVVEGELVIDKQSPDCNFSGGLMSEDDVKNVKNNLVKLGNLRGATNKITDDFVVDAYMITGGVKFAMAKILGISRPSLDLLLEKRPHLESRFNNLTTDRNAVCNNNLFYQAVVEKNVKAQIGYLQINKLPSKEAPASGIVKIDFAGSALPNQSIEAKKLSKSMYISVEKREKGKKTYEDLGEDL